MLEIRWHGRGGQGAITVSKILALGALGCGKYAQAFPEYGPERGGAPVKAYNRLDDEPIVLHSGVYEPHRVVVIDETLLETEDVTGGLTPDGALIVNTRKTPETIREQTGYSGRIFCVDADAIAEEVGTGFSNVPTLGAVVPTLDFLTMEAMEAALREFLGAKIGESIIEANLKTLRWGAERVDSIPLGEKGRKPNSKPKAKSPSGRARTLPGYRELPLGAVVLEENRVYPQTGGWRNQKPVFDENVCVNCLLCWVHCPEPAVATEGRLMTGFDYRYCKGCGICEAICPSGAISMVPEGSEVA